MTSIHHTIVGLPRSGKTTFLAALFHLVDSGEVASELRIDSYSGDQSYLNQIVSDWLRCKEVIRTSQAGDTHVELRLIQQVSGTRITLAFPDLAGELFETQVTQRRCSKSYVEGCNLNGGIFLFVSADRPGDEGMTVVEQNAIVGPALDQPQSLRTAVPWTHTLMPPQVQLVELLQFMQSPPFNLGVRRVAVVISAWDLVGNPQPTPDVWLEREMPLLSQFLHANRDAFDFRVYGISALGGDIQDTAQRAKLIAMPHSERIVCVGHGCSKHDLTAPLLWLSSGDRGVE